ncbi:MAG: DNA phosphorothioation system restriction enzyme [Microcystaceae cyanobacterium]
MSTDSPNLDNNSLKINWEKLIRYYQSKLSQKVAENKLNYSFEQWGTPKFPNNLFLRKYQHQAVLNWLKHQGRGTLKMATGSGKTITALAIVTELYHKIGLQMLVVVCPYRHLVTQWERECKRFNLSPILAFESVHNWQHILSNQLYNLTNQQQEFITVITTNSTLITEGFQSEIRFFPEKTLIVGDEAHNLGSAQLEDKLPRKIGLRLALSATPERYYDEEGTEALFSYFGDILKPEFTLKNAIEQGALVPYLYYPIFVELTESEAWQYAKITQRIGWSLQKTDNWQKNENITALLLQRSRLVGTAENKIKALRELMSDRKNTDHTLFYCGDGYLTNNEQDYRRQVEVVTQILGQEIGYRVNTYTADTSLEEREKIREQFDQGELQGLVAIRCLDEGVDIPSIQTGVILASTGNPRQFIQRRGRILRPHYDKKQATLFDMIVLPPELDRETWEVERNLLRKELKRFIQFAELATNAHQATQQLKSILERYGMNSENYS